MLIKKLDNECALTVDGTEWRLHHVVYGLLQFGDNPTTYLGHSPTNEEIEEDTLELSIQLCQREIAQSI